MKYENPELKWILMSAEPIMASGDVTPPVEEGEEPGMLGDQSGEIIDSWATIPLN